MTDFAPDVIALLVQNGCILVRHGKGDHDIWFSPINNRRLVVDGKIKSRHTANGVLKQAGLRKAF
jgi:predicted RNA binding protein YcfA (HicA-like mRNA interferase family)